jgi:hypothetical protein
MILITHTDPVFTELILFQIPRIAQVPLIRELMKKYTSGFLTDQRLTDAMKLGTMPMVKLEKLKGADAAASGVTKGDLITIDSSDFEGFKERHPTYLLQTPITVLHEISHWGYWKGQQAGHPSDTFGRAHNNHGENKSPLNTELEKVFRTIAFLAR